MSCGHRSRVAEQVREHGARPRRPGATPCDTCASCSGSPSSTTFRARADRERVGERDLSRLVDEEVVERAVELLAREEPGGAGEEVVVGVDEVAGRPRSLSTSSLP